MSIDRKVEQEVFTTRPPGKFYAAIEYFTGYFALSDLMDKKVRQGRVFNNVLAFGAGIIPNEFHVYFAYYTLGKQDHDLRNFAIGFGLAEGYRMVMRTINKVRGYKFL